MTLGPRRTWEVASLIRSFTQQTRRRDAQGPLDDWDQTRRAGCWHTATLPSHTPALSQLLPDQGHGPLSLSDLTRQLGHFTWATSVTPSNPAAGLTPPPFTGRGTEAWKGTDSSGSYLTHAQPLRGL